MPRYRNHLPQLNGDLFLADGGMGTTLLFRYGIDLPHFCSFHLVGDPAGRQVLIDYFRPYAAVTRAQRAGFVLDSGPTWRASSDWGNRLGYSAADLDRFNREAIELMCLLRGEFESKHSPVVISGCMGPRGDGYEPGEQMTADEARDYHAVQIGSFADTEADMITAMTLTYADEAVGITRAAVAAGMPIVISFTVETDGRLPTGQGLGEAIDYVDRATGEAPVYYMINCAHPSHFSDVLEAEARWTGRLRGIRLNASCLSHAELNDATELDDGDARELGAQVARICADFPQINVVGGCCGTDSRHIAEIGKSLAGSRALSAD